ncbi:hypothetical protein M8C21_034003, partial [Ambrosia artemisiifolia]
MTDISGYGSIDFADSVATMRKLNRIIHENDLDEICTLYDALCESSMLALPCREDIEQCVGTILSLLLDMLFPCQWLWDLVDEFVNQFQSFSRYRALETKTEKDIALLRLNHEAWSVHHVLHLLQGLIKDSKSGKRWRPSTVDTTSRIDAVDDHGCTPRSNVLKVLGYFSMVGLLRVHCLLGNYQAGLDCLLPIDISQEGFYTSLIATRITTIYHYGFANLMLGRYAKAIQEFNHTLVYIFETKQPQQNEQILNKIEKMYALLAICLSLCPSQHQFIDENVNSQLMEKYGEKMSRMQRYDDDDDDVALYRELLSYAWPAFSTPFAPSSGAPREVYDKEELAYYDDELLSSAYPEFFGPSASSYGGPLVNHNQLEVVIAN